MKTIPSLILSAALLAVLPVEQTFANSATWATSFDGDWSEVTNWTPNTTYPGLGVAVDQVATFSTRSGTTTTIDVNLDVDVTLGGLVMTPNASWSYQIASASGKKITLANSSGTASLSFNGGGGGVREIQTAMDLDTNTISISGRKGTFSGNLTAINGRNITLNVTSIPQGSAPDVFVFNGSNSFGAGTINLAGEGALFLGNAMAGGGSATTIHFTDTTKRTTLGLSTTGTVDYGNKIVVDAGARGQISVKANSANSSIGDIRVNSTGYLRLTTDNGHRLITVDGDVYVAAGALLLGQADSTQNSRSITVNIADGNTVSGSGMIATAASGASPNVPITLKSGAILAPGDPEVAGSTAILSIGGVFDSVDYSESLFTLESGAKIQFDLNGTVAGTDYDQILVAGTGVFSLNGAIAEFNLLTGSYQSTDVVVLMDFAENATRIGMFAGLDEGATVMLGGGSAEISYFGGTGNDVVLTNFSVIPEPGVVWLLGLALVAGVGMRLRDARRAGA